MPTRERTRFRAAPPAQTRMITWVPTGSLTPNPRNARTHNRKQIQALAVSLERFGFTKPIITDGNGMVVAGHGCLAAAKYLGLEGVPVIRLTDLSREQIRAYALADNKLAEKSGWDFPILAIEVKELGELGVDLTIPGFEPGEIDGLVDDSFPRAEPEDEIASPSPETPCVTRPGELFVLGNKHRLLCGDATNPDDVGALFDKVKPTLMVTDPPYGVSYDPGWRHRLGVNRSKRSSSIRNDHRADWRDAWALFPGDVVYVWHAAVHAASVHESLSACNFEVRAEIIWAKNRFPIGRGDYHWAHEPCLYAVRQGKSGNWCGNRKQTTLWQIPALDGQLDSATSHATQKPVECMKRPILNNSRVGEAIYDPFLGSGTSLIAAERTGRIAFGLEIDARYVDVAILRWQRITGKDAILAGTAKTFDELSAERLPTSIFASDAKPEAQISETAHAPGKRSRRAG